MWLPRGTGPAVPQRGVDVWATGEETEWAAGEVSAQAMVFSFFSFSDFIFYFVFPFYFKSKI